MKFTEIKSEWDSANIGNNIFFLVDLRPLDGEAGQPECGSSTERNMHKPST